MDARTVPAGRGWQWIRESLALLRSATMPLVPMGMLMMFTLVLLAAVPVIGGALPVIAAPALTFGFVQGVRAVAQRRPVTPWMLYGAFNVPARTGGPASRPGDTAPPAPTGRLLTLGAFNLVFTLLAAAAANAVDDGAGAALLRGDPAGTPDEPVDVRMLWGAMTFAALYVPGQMALWFAPLFTGWHAVPPLKAMFFSAVACWRNRAAFLVFGLGWFALLTGVTLVIRLLALVLGGIALLAAAPVMLVLATALCVSLWPAWRDIVDSPLQRGGP